MNKPPAFRIRDWDKHFENSESRKYKSLSWVPIKNKHDGKGYRRVAAHPQAVQILCAWYLIVEVASKMPERGVLADEDGPLTPADLSFMTGLPEQIFDTALKALSHNSIRWIDAGLSGNLPANSEMPGETTVEQNRTEQNNSPSLGEVEPPQGFPKTEREAVDAGGMVGVDAKTSALAYHKAVSRGFTDAKGNTIRKFASYLKTEQAYGSDYRERQKRAQVATGAKPSRNTGTHNDGIEHEYESLVRRAEPIPDTRRPSLGADEA